MDVVERGLSRADERKIETGIVRVVYDGTNMPAVHRAIDEALGVNGQGLAKGLVTIHNALHPDTKLPETELKPNPHVSK